MSVQEHLSANDLVFTNNGEKGIFSGGFGVNSILMKEGISPIQTINNNYKGGSKVSDIFDNIVIPNWALSYDIKSGGKLREAFSDEEDTDFIDDDLHDKLFNLVQPKPKTFSKKNKRNTKKKTKKNTI
jgi:hypothetical protein